VELEAILYNGPVLRGQGRVSLRVRTSAHNYWYLVCVAGVRRITFSSYEWEGAVRCYENLAQRDLPHTVQPVQVLRSAVPA